MSQGKLRLSYGMAIGIAMLLVLAACGGGGGERTAAPTATSAALPTATPRPVPTPTSPPTPAPKGPAGTLTVAVNDLAAEVWVPRLSSGSEIALMALIADPLIANNTATRALEGRLLGQWSVQRTGTETVWSFKLRPGIVINEGKGTLTSDDIRFNFAEYLKSDARNSITSAMRLLIDSNINNFETVSPTEFKLHSTKFDVTSMRSLSLGQNFVTMAPKAYSEAVGDSGYSSHPIGTGSYFFKSGQKGSKYTLEAVPDHWRRTANVQTVNLLLVPEVATRVAMLKTGQVEMAPLEKRFKNELTGNLRNVPIRKQALAFVALGGQYYDLPEKICTTCPWVGNTANALKVRQALTIAIDRKAIIDKLLFGEAEIAAAPFSWVPGPFPHVDPAWPAPAFDPARAKQLLAEAGYPNGFSIEFAFLSSAGFPEGLDASEAVAGFWEAIGIKVKRSPMDFNPTFREKMASRTTAGFAWLLSNSFKDEPLPDMRNLFSKSGAIAYLHDPKIDEFIAKASQETDDAARAALGRDLGGYIVEQRIGIPLFAVNGIWGASSRVASWENITAYPFLNNVETIALSSG